jgi:molybdopterin-guanine dinucleotide biosynthesis protein A
MMPAASAIILAGGQSRRMGRPKAALRFGNCSILERLINELSTSFDEILVAAAPEQVEPFAIEHLLMAHSSARLLRDPLPFEGAALALARSLSAATNDVVFACSCDMPLLRAGLARSLCTMLEGYEAVVPYINGSPQPLCAAYRRNVARFLQAEVLSGERRLTCITSGLRARRPKAVLLRQFDQDLRSFINVNTPEDYSRALAIKEMRDPGQHQ